MNTVKKRAFSNRIMGFEGSNPMKSHWSFSFLFLFSHNSKSSSSGFYLIRFLFILSLKLFTKTPTFCFFSTFLNENLLCFFDSYSEWFSFLTLLPFLLHLFYMKFTFFRFFLLLVFEKNSWSLIGIGLSNSSFSTKPYGILVTIFS